MDMLMKIGHDANMQCERIAERLPDLGVEMDRCVCLSVITGLLED